MTAIIGFLDGIKPMERLTPSDWADKYRFLSSSASAEPGRWRTSRTPYLREIMDRLSPYDECEEISIMKGAQLGFTEAGFNAIGYFIHLDPCSIMYIMPTLDTIKRNSKMRITPMIEATPVLSNKIMKARKKDSGNSMFQKDFPGGTLIMAGANSASSLRSVPIKVVVLDEVDAYPSDLDGEGSPIDLAKARTRTFAKRKLMYFSTPLVHGSSVIEGKYLESSQRKYFVPCPHCSEMQYLDFKKLKYDKDERKKPINIRYECIKCKKGISEHHKTEMLAGGEWRDTFPKKADKKKYAYQINSLYSPLGWYSWKNAIEDWLLAQDKADKLKVFVNTVLGETWLEKGEVPEWENIYNRRIQYDITKPPKAVIMITIGVDVQIDRLELEIKGWGKNQISYSLGYRIIAGETSKSKVWEELGKVLKETWVREDGLVIPVRRMAIDTGYNTAFVYDFCRAHSPKIVTPIKGQETLAVMYSMGQAVDHKKSRRKHNLKGLVLYKVGVSIIKSELYGRLKKKIEFNEETGKQEIPHGYLFFPQEYNQHYFKMLTAEQLQKKIVNGYTRYFWEKIRERNEALDCNVYARAAAAISGMDKMSEAHWDALESSYSQRTTTKPTNRAKRKDSFW